MSNLPFEDELNKKSDLPSKNEIEKKSISVDNDGGLAFTGNVKKVNFEGTEINIKKSKNVNADEKKSKNINSDSDAEVDVKNSGIAFTGDFENASFKGAKISYEENNASNGSQIIKADNGSQIIKVDNGSQANKAENGSVIKNYNIKGITFTMLLAIIIITLGSVYSSYASHNAKETINLEETIREIESKFELEKNLIVDLWRAKDFENAIMKSNNLISYLSESIKKVGKEKIENNMQEIQQLKMLVLQDMKKTN